MTRNFTGRTQDPGTDGVSDTDSDTEARAKYSQQVSRSEAFGFVVSRHATLTMASSSYNRRSNLYSCGEKREK
jgi:hypothetical protein